MSENAFFVYNKRDYFYESEPQCIRPYRFGERVMRPVFAACGKSKERSLPEFFISKEALRFEKIIITDTVFNPPLFRALQRKIDPEQLFLFYMNPIAPGNSDYIQCFLPGHVYTYDQAQSQRYNIKYRHLPYSDRMHLEKAEPLYDSLFIGMEKGRLEKIREAADLMEAYGLKPKVMLCDSSDPHYRMRHYIRYTEYLQYLARSKTILEINAEGQTSCTLRFLESLFFQKKLVTDNVHIVEDPYYDPANVFVLGENDPATLPEFVTQPYQDSNQDLSGLSFGNWIQDW